MTRPEGKPDFSSLRRALEKHQTWPTRYTFKFIVKRAAVSHLIALLDGHEISTRDSAKGTYTAVTANAHMRTPGEVIAIYERVATVEGILSF